MPAPDLATLYRVEPAIEEAWRGILESEGIDSYIQRDQLDLPVPRVDVQLSLGSATGHRGLRPQGDFALDAWNASLTFTVVTKRVDDQPADHAEYLATIRRCAQYYSDRLGPDVLPYHCVVYIQESNTVPSVQLEDETDRSALTFECIVCFRTNAWPELTPAP